MPCLATAAMTASRCSSQPVVPITRLTPSAAIRSTLRSTAEGMEKSMATSMPRKFSGVMPSKTALLNSSSLSATVKPYSGASCSTSFPILPYPTIASSGMDGLPSFEHFRIKLGEKLLMQRRDRAEQVGFGQNQADVEQRRALRNHADVNAVEGVEDAPGHSRGVADVVANQADNHLVLLDIDLGELLQLGHDGVEVRGVVDGERNADFGGGHHIDRRFEAVEDLEDAVQEAVCHQHARGMDVHQRDFALAGDRFDHVGARDGLSNNARAGHFGPP